jgi:hypothetical protein
VQIEEERKKVAQLGKNFLGFSKNVEKSKEQEVEKLRSELKIMQSEMKGNISGWKVIHFV